MKKVYRVYFVHNNEAKTRVDLGITLGKYKFEGLGWTRAAQLVTRDHMGALPRGKIEFEAL
jgi:hypothetical protein